MERGTTNRRLLGEFDLEEHSLLVDKESFKVKIPDMEKKVFEAEVDGKPVKVEFLDDLCCGKPIFLNVEGKLYKIELHTTNTNACITVKVDGIPYLVRLKSKNRANSKMAQPTLSVVRKSFSVSRGFDKGVISASMPGKVALLRVKTGDFVHVGDVLLVLESMKMENEIVSPLTGMVKDVKVSKGSTVNLGEAMVVIDES